MTPRVSIVLRSRSNENLTSVISSIHQSSDLDVPPELVIVKEAQCSESFRRGSTIVVNTPARRIEAKAIGVEVASGDNVLFLDSDQFLSSSLLAELRGPCHDMCFIPERSQNRNLIGRLMDSKREIVERLYQTTLRPTLPVAPRFFKRVIAKQVFERLPEKVRKFVTEAEDSLIFHEALKVSHDIGWTTSQIFNLDPSVREFVKKSFTYGRRNEGAVVERNLDPELRTFVRSIQLDTIVNNRSGLNRAVMLNLVRGVPYVAGMMSARLGGAR